jgi:hypothetical protein
VEQKVPDGDPVGEKGAVDPGLLRSGRLVGATRLRYAG